MLNFLPSNIISFIDNNDFATVDALIKESIRTEDGSYTLYLALDNLYNLLSLKSNAKPLINFSLSLKKCVDKWRYGRPLG